MQRRNIETDTPLLPLFIAEAVVAEASGFLKTELPDDLARRLAERAEHLYQVNSDVRRKLQAKGNAGRDYLYSVMRHWLHGLHKAEQPRLADRLPASFALGHPV